MKMVGRIAIIPALASGPIQPQDLVLTGQEFQVAVDGPQADFRKCFPHQGMDFIRGGVGNHFFDFFQNDLTLFGAPGFLFLSFHNFIINDNGYYFRQYSDLVKPINTNQKYWYSWLWLEINSCLQASAPPETERISPVK
jgi:hypothetical protein